MATTRPAIPLDESEFERARLSAWILDIIRRKSARLQPSLSKCVWRILSYSGRRHCKMISSNWRSEVPSLGVTEFRRSRHRSFLERKSSGFSYDRIFTVCISRCAASKASHEQPSNFSLRAAQASYPCPTPSSRVLPSNLRTTEKAGSDIVKKRILNKL